MQTGIIFEEKTDVTHTVLWEEKYIAHISVVNSPGEVLEMASRFDSSNKLKIYLRGDLRDDFKYDVVYHIVTSAIMIKNLKFTIHYFSDIDDMSLLSLICTYFNIYHSQELQIEQGETQYIVKNGNNIILQSFF